MPPYEYQTIEKLMTYPTVKEFWSNVSYYYGSVKDQSVLIDNTFSLAETSMGKMAYFGQPVLNKIQPQLQCVDSIMSSRLNQLEENYPSMKAPAAEVMEKTKGYCNSMVQPVFHTAIFPYTFAKTTVVNTTNSIQSVSLFMIDQSLNTLEVYIDYYLPNDDITTENYQSSESKSTEATQSVSDHSKNVIKKFNRRLLKRSHQSITTLRDKSFEYIQHAKDHLLAMQQVQSILNGSAVLTNELKDRLAHLAQNSEKSFEMTDDFSKEVSEKEIEKLEGLMGQLRETSHYYLTQLSNVMYALSGMIYDRLDDSKKIKIKNSKETVAQILDDLKNKSPSLNTEIFHRGQEALDYAKSTLDSMLQTILNTFPSEWLSKTGSKNLENESHVSVDELISTESSEMSDVLSSNLESADDAVNFAICSEVETN